MKLKQMIFGMMVGVMSLMSTVPINAGEVVDEEGMPLTMMAPMDRMARPLMFKPVFNNILDAIRGNAEVARVEELIDNARDTLSDRDKEQLLVVVDDEIDANRASSDSRGVKSAKTRKLNKIREKIDANTTVQQIRGRAVTGIQGKGLRRSQ